MYRWIVFLHVVGVFTFLISHGVSVGVLFTLRRERNVDRIRLLLQQSQKAGQIMAGALLFILITGVTSTFIAGLWNKVWIWLSLALLIGLWGVMAVLGTRVFNQVRVGVGLPPTYGQPPDPRLLNPAELDALLNQTHPTRLTIIGSVGLALIAALMVFKPF